MCLAWIAAHKISKNKRAIKFLSVQQICNEKRNKNAGKVAKDFFAAQTRRKWMQARVIAEVERILFDEKRFVR